MKNRLKTWYRNFLILIFAPLLREWHRPIQASTTLLIQQLRKAELLAGGGNTQQIADQIGELEKLMSGIPQPHVDVSSGIVHPHFPLLLVALQLDIPVWLYGNAGSGKSTAARKAAEHMKLPYRFISLCPTTTKSDLLGYRDGYGTYHGTAFREVYQHGGVFNFDEIDNGNPSVLAVVNEALANGECSFPDGNIAKHPNARFVSCANTLGKGATMDYIGRNKLDGTTLDRFAFVEMNTSDELELALCCGGSATIELIDPTAGKTISKKSYVKFVQNVRKIVDDIQLRHLVTPRASLYGCRLLDAGVSFEYVKDMVVWKGLPMAEQEKILANISKKELV